MSAAVRSLYIYWKVAPRDLAPALAAVRSFQSTLEETADVQRRVEDTDGAVTLMEIYPGLDAAGCSERITRSQAALGAWAVAGRHAEVFEPA